MSYDATQILPELRHLARRVGRSNQIEHDDLVQAACLRLWRLDRECTPALAMTIAERAMVDEIRHEQGRVGTLRHANRHRTSLNEQAGTSEDADMTRMDMLEAVGADPLAYVLAREVLAEHAAEQEQLRRAPKINGVPRFKLEGQPLSPREIDVLEQARLGHNAAETAANLTMSEHTVKSHRGKAQTKLGARNAVHAVAIMYDRGLWPVASVA